MTATSQHLANAKDYIARGEDYYRKAAEEMRAAMESGCTLAAVAREVGRSRDWVRTLVAWATECRDPDTPPFGGDQENSARYERQARTVLKDPERRAQAMADLPTEQIEQVIQQAHEVVVSRVHAQRAEQSAAPAEPTIRDLTGGERFDPSESWADLHIARAWQHMHTLAKHVAKWGVVLGSMTDEQALEDVQRIEREAAEIRVALQERVRDQLRQEV